MNVAVLACFIVASTNAHTQRGDADPYQFYVRLGLSSQLEVVAKYAGQSTKVIYQREIKPATPYLEASLKLAINPKRKVLLLPSKIDYEDKGFSVILREISYSGKVLSTRTVNCKAKSGSANLIYAGFDEDGKATVVWNTAELDWYRNEELVASTAEKPTHYEKLPKNLYLPGDPGSLISSDQWCDLVSPIFDSTIYGRNPGDKIFDLVRGFGWGGELTNEGFSWKSGEKQGILKLDKRDETAVAVKMREFPYVTVIMRAPTYSDQLKLDTDYVPRAYRYNVVVGTRLYEGEYEDSVWVEK